MSEEDYVGFGCPRILLSHREKTQLFSKQTSAWPCQPRKRLSESLAQKFCNLNSDKENKDEMVFFDIIFTVGCKSRK